MALAVALLGGSCGLPGSADTEKAQASMLVFPNEDFLVAGIEGGPFFPSSKVYLITNTGDESLRWRARSTDASVGFSASSGTLNSGESEIVTVLVNHEILGGMPPGHYTHGLTFENETTGTDVEQGVDLAISSAGALELSPAIGFSSAGPVGGPFQPLSAPYVLSNGGSTPIAWSAESSESWLSASVTSGTLQTGTSQNLSLDLDPDQAGQLPSGGHVASVVFHDLSNGSDYEVLVTLTITTPAQLAVSPGDGFTTAGQPGGPFSPSTKTYTLTNVGAEILTWQAGADANWVTLSSTSGSLAPAQQASVVVEIDSAATNSLGDGTHATTLSFANTTSGLGSTTRQTSLTLSSPPASLVVTPAQGFSSTGSVGGPFQPSSKTYTLTNTGGRVMNWAASVPVSWLVLDRTAGILAPAASTQVTVSIQQGVAAGQTIGSYSAQISFSNLTNGAGSTPRGASLSIGSSGGTPPTLLPGDGFAGPTAEPDQIGTGSAKCIARWDVVPHQTIAEAVDAIFEIGIVAFHIAGIDRVSFSVEGGTFVDVPQMTLNPRTGVWEYVALLDASAFAADGPIEVRAIAYPNGAAPQADGTGSYPGGGFPRLLDSLFLYVDTGAQQAPNVAYCSTSGSDSTGSGSATNPFRTPWTAAQAVHAAGSGEAGGGIVYLDAGTYSWAQSPSGDTPTPVTTNRWLTFTPKPGVLQGQVVFNAGGHPGLRIGKSRLYNLTVNTAINGSAYETDSIWLDHVECSGNGNGTHVHFGGFTPGNEWNFIYWTDTNTQNDTFTISSNVDLARNCSGKNASYGPNNARCVINCTWDNLSQANGSHPDWIVYNAIGAANTVDNRIWYGNTATRCDAQGIFWAATGYWNNIAFVNNAMEGNGSAPTWIGGGGCVSADHLLFWNFTHRGGGNVFFWNRPQAALSNISVRGCYIQNMGIGPFGDGVSDSWFDENAFGNPGFAPGTRVTTLDPEFVSTFTPGPTSPLRSGLRSPPVPVDKDNALRGVPATIGAVE